MKFLEYKGLKLINLSPHPLIFEDEKILEVFDQSLVKKIYATPVEEAVDNEGLFVRTTFKQNKESYKILKKIKDSGFTVISSIINAQAYPSLCVSPIVTPETARSPPDQKRIQYKFNMYF